MTTAGCSVGDRKYKQLRLIINNAGNLKDHIQGRAQRSNKILLKINAVRVRSQVVKEQIRLKAKLFET